MANSILKMFLLLFSVLFISFAFAKGNSSRTPAYYKGPIYNVFFHPIIAYPKLAFDPKNDHLKYIDSWFVTKREFKKIIPKLYEQGFILVSPKDVFEEKKDKQNQLIIKRKKIFLPVGKKPLILSLDDYNFYTNMKLHGTVHRFWVDQHNRLATVTKQNTYHTIIGYDQEIPQLLEDFIVKHPDFSFNHARGIFALTGFNGIFGYPIQQASAPDYHYQLGEVKKIVTKLKELGWEFGSHSYFHLSSDQQSLHDFAEAEKRWIREIGSLVGKSPYYIFPFGDPWHKDKNRMKLLKSLGYKYFFGVSSSLKIMTEPGAVIMKRFPIDGLSLRNRYQYGKPFIAFNQVLDNERPQRINNRKQ